LEQLHPDFDVGARLGRDGALGDDPERTARRSTTPTRPWRGAGPADRAPATPHSPPARALVHRAEHGGIGPGSLEIGAIARGGLEGEAVAADEERDIGGPHATRREQADQVSLP
jgi:hypothetical protein